MSVLKQAVELTHLWYAFICSYLWLVDNFVWWNVLCRVEQVVLMSRKHINQKQRKGRDFLKETIMIPFFVLAFTGFLFHEVNKVTTESSVYGLHSLPPLSSSSWGIFNSDNKFHVGTTGLLYSPADSSAVQDLIAALVTEYPDIKPVPCGDSGCYDTYRTNFFDTWATLEFNLTSDQFDTFISDQSGQTLVDYTINVNTMAASLPRMSHDPTVYNDRQASADLWWASGYMTLQNFVSTYLAKQYDTTAMTFEVDTFVQRYPKSGAYPNKETLNLATSRWSLWRWLGPVILTIVIFTPLLGLCTETVRERQFKMKDLLEISGLMAPSYWTSYVVTILLCCQVTMWWSELLLYGFTIFDEYRILPYAALMTSYTVALATFSMAFGFIVFRSEYYGLPAFLLSTGLSVAGLYLACNYHISVETKLFISFLCPQAGFSVGLFTIEQYFHKYGSVELPYSWSYPAKNMPSLLAINAVLIMSGILYGILAWGTPLMWLTQLPYDDFVLGRSNPKATREAVEKDDEIEFPCDDEEDDDSQARTNIQGDDDNCLLNVDSLSHVYADGTNAVKNISFKVRKGEVLSFLGANGAGKSTTMGMLCGTLEATIGDATVNGYSITTSRTQARRNLGICMQQDIIWDDVSVEDHLLLFGGLRGLYGKALRDDVEAMIVSLGFPEKRYSLAGTLSGGQKRRLCVGLSLVGGNSVVYLDEPTAGLDPVSRRQLWELVQRNRHGRAILLTTHFMDEADVLGDRIAIIKEGRLRAIGTSSFLKTRFGLGYLLRMSLQEGSNPQNIIEKVQSYAPDATIASSAGTELSVRISKASVGEFPRMFETLEAENRTLGVVSFGIETTTLEEVFMRIVNEDNETLLLNHADANRMLGGSFEERQQHEKALRARDDKRNPLSGDMMQALLCRGRAPGASRADVLLPQLRVMLRKRFHQFVRSKGQWTLGFLVPIATAICIGAVIQGMPEDILGPTPSYINTVYQDIFPIPIAGSSEARTNAFALDSGFSASETTYVAQTYAELFSDISSSSVTPSTNGIYYQADNNFTVLYNASYPLDFAAAVTNALDGAISNATQGRLSVNAHANSLPSIMIGLQLNTSFLTALLFAVFAGSIGAALSIVISGERVQLVKHQQLASGASKTAYWAANMIFDGCMFYMHTLILLIVLVCFSSESYSGSSFGYLALVGIPFVIASTLRFYTISFFVADIRMAQTVYFYGSLFAMFVEITLLFVVVFISADADISEPNAQVLCAVWTIIDPLIAFYLYVMFSHNFLAVQTLNGGASILEINVSMFLLLMFVDIPLYSLLVAYYDGTLGACWRWCCCCCYTGGGQGSQSGYTATGERDIELLESQANNKPAEMSDVSDESGSGHIRVSTDVRGPVRVVPANPAPRPIGGGHDPDVQDERQRVEDIVNSGAVNPTQNSIFIHSLRKVYYGRGTVPTKVAVKDVSITIPHGEVFGLLGANGAGKTTLLKMVSGQEDPSSGNALINGYDVVHQRSSAQMSMGLCPQFDTLVERLSVRENLLFFGAIKGLAGRELETVCDAFMVALNIKRYANKLIMQLSGGNRRKVSLAVALLGAPPTVYLDEPSTGLDPVASRLMWRLLSKISSKKVGNYENCFGTSIHFCEFLCCCRRPPSC
jgi:ABC-type multidrug transport system ATPase subunit